MKTEHAYILLLGGAILTILGAIMTTVTLYRLGRPYAEVTDRRLARLLFFIVLAFAGFVAIAFALATSAKAQVPDGYKTRAQISACTLQGCSTQTWFLRNPAWCGKTADGWSPTQGTGKLSVQCVKAVPVR